MPKAEKLTEAAVHFLQEKHIAHFVTLMTDGSPQVTPVWVDVDTDGSHVLINSSEGRVKTRNAARDPRVAVSVLDEQDPFKFVIVRGQVVERNHEDASAHIDSLAKKYTGAERYPYNRGQEQRVILRIKPDYVLEQGLA